MNAPATTPEPIAAVPANLAAERALLGTVLLVNDRLDAAGFIRPEMFFDPLHAVCWAAILKCVEARRPADPVTILPDVQGPLLDAAGGLEFFTRLIDDVPTTKHAGDYARAVADTWRLRELLRATIVATRDQNADQAIETVQSALLNLTEVGVRRTSTVTGAELAAGYRARSPVRGLSTGIAALNSWIGGLRPGDLTIIAGRPGMGKTAVMLWMAYHLAARAGRTIGFISLEMTPEKLYDRLISLEARVQGGELPYEDIIKGDLVGEAQDFSDHRMPDLHDLVIVSEPGLTVARLRTCAIGLKRRPKALAALFIDYLQLMAPGTAYRGQRASEVQEISRSLKALAIELGVPVVVGCQLNRGVEGREEKRPQLSDLRESGAIEQDADLVMACFRPEYYVRQRRPNPKDQKAENDYYAELLAARNKLELGLLKNRDGRTGWLTVGCDIAHNWIDG